MDERESELDNVAATTENGSAAPDDAITPSNKGWKGLIVFLVFVVAVILLTVFTPLREYFTRERIEELASDLGVWGPFIIVAVGVISPLLFLPRFPVAVVAGALYGVVNGTLLATTASTGGALVHFYLAKTLLSPMSQRLSKRYRIRAMDVSPQKTFLIIFFLRAFPLSNFVATNLLAGALRVHLGNYILASFLGMLPSSIMYTAWGKAASRPSSGSYIVAVGSVAFIVIGTLAARRWFLPWFRGLRASAAEQSTDD